MLHIVLATRNAHKVKELTGLLAVSGVRWHTLAEFPHVPTPPETGETFDANAIEKAVRVARATGAMALADDSGLEVTALGGLPGVWSARFAGRHGDDAANNAELLRRLSGVAAGRRQARYRCTLALADGSRVLALARGSWDGRIAPQPRGRGGFGYDPLFLVPALGRTVGELPASVKRRLSHRAKAAARMRTLLTRLSARRRTGAGGGRSGRVRSGTPASRRSRSRGAGR